MQILSKNNIRFWLFCLVMTLIYGFVFVFSEFYEMPYRGVKDFLALLFQWGVIEMCVFGLLYFISIFRWLFAFIFPLLTVSCSILTYYRYTAHVTLTPMIIDLAVVNDVRTSLDVVSWWLLLVVIVALLVSLYVVRLRFHMPAPRPWWMHVVISLLVLNTPLNVPAAWNAVRQRMPMSLYFVTKEYLENRRLLSQKRPAFAGEVHCGSDSLTVVFVLGESLRAANLQINGYGRPTMPLLCKEKNVVSLPYVWSDYYLTHTSVPHLLTRSDEKHSERAFRERSFISLMKQAGYKTTWIANQESVETFIYFMKECDSLIYVNGGKNLYMNDHWLDSDVLPYYKKVLAGSNPKKFILVHTIGSHWWYNAHYPKAWEIFKPVIKSKIITANTEEEMRNSYDNTIRYTDYVWHELINPLRHRNAILIYLSDHAENLGENGYFTHGVDRPELHRPACFVWYSDEFALRYPQKIEALKLHKDKRLKSYILFHSILDAADIKSRYIEPQRDIFTIKNK